jgi:hypothetical protein
MAFKLIEAAQDRWRAVNAPHLAALVRAGAISSTGNSSNDLAIRPSQKRPNNLDPQVYNCSQLVRLLEGRR